MNKFKRLLSVILAVLMVFGSINLSPLTAKAETNNRDLFKASIVEKHFTSSEEQDQQRAERQKFGDIINEGIMSDSNVEVPIKGDMEISENDEVRVIIQLEAPSLYEISKTKNISLSQAASYESSVTASQSNMMKAISSYGEVKHTFKSLINGFSATVRYGDLNSLRNLNGVKSVTVANKYYIDMNTALDLTNAKKVWADTYKIKGEGTVVAIIDSGIDYTHKDMQLTDPSKAKLNEASVKALGGPGRYFTAKVPYGWNFADSNDRVIPQQSMHGMHVSGIVGANGDDNEVSLGEAIKGVAPEAQLLAMKVFTNNPDMPSCFSDDVVAALDDSVKHKADVINMSLGSDAGFVDKDDPEIAAVKNATDAGVVVVISAGNAAYTGYYYDDLITSEYATPKMDQDISTYGRPSTAPDSLGVASINNVANVEVLEYTSLEGKGEIGYTPTVSNPVGKISGEKELVFCGKGIPSDFVGKSVAGKIALIERGGISFADKTNNAEAAGAIGVIIFNRVTPSDDYFGMDLGEGEFIPCVSIKRVEGLKLVELLAKSVSVKVAFNGKVVKEANRMSDFSSWGATPDLSFKPEVTAPGGKIYSTINANKYEYMSGTSMAAPHTSGATALLIQHLKNLGIKQGTRSFAELTKNILISTSVPQIDPDVNLPYLARKQGAGLIQIDKAIDTNAYVLGMDGNATIALKEIGNTTQAQIMIKNFGNKELKFVPSIVDGVLTNKIVNDCISINSAKIPGATVSFDKSEIDIPAKGIGLFTMTLNIPVDTMKNIFAEGFIKLTDLNGNNVEIGIPFMGFYGDWSGNNAPRMIDDQKDSPNSYFGQTGLQGAYANGKLVYLGAKGYPETTAFSPNNDNWFDSVLPKVSFMRNAKEYKVQVLDNNGQVIRELSYGENRKKNFVDYDGYNMKNTSVLLSGAEWTGELYNSKTGEYEIAKDGQYFIRVTARPDYEGSLWYNLDMPVKLDTTNPTLEASGELLEHNQYKITIGDVNDGEGSGILEVYASIYDKEGNYLGSQALDLETTNEDVITLPNAECTVEVTAGDFALNETTVALGNVVNDNIILNPNDVEAYYYNTKDVTIDYTVKASLEYDHVSIKLDTLDSVDNKKETSYKMANLSDGLHKVTISVFDATNKCLGEVVKEFYVDTVKPVITVLDEYTEIKNLDDGTYECYYAYYITEEGAKDTGYTKVYANGNLLKPIIAPAAGKENDPIKKNYFEYVFIASEVDNKITVTVDDLAGNQTVNEITVDVKIDKPIILVDEPVVKELNAVVSGKVVYKQGHEITEFTVDGKPVELKDGNAFKTTLNYDSFGNKVVTFKAVADDATETVTTTNVMVSPFSFESKALLTNKDSQKIDFEIDPTQPLTTSIKVLVNGKAVEKTITGQDFAVTTSGSIVVEGLSPKENKIEFQALDENSNIIASDIVEVFFDNILPTINLFDEDGNNVEEYLIYTQDSILVHGEVSEPVKYLFINGVPFEIKNKKFVGEINFTDGTNRIDVLMEDIAGNIENYVFRADVDTTRPIIAMQDPIGDVIITNEDVYTLRFMVKDNTYTQNVYINGQAVPDIMVDQLGTGNTQQFINYDYNIPEGKSIVTIEVVDDFGLASIKTITFYKNYKAAIVFADRLTFDQKIHKGIVIDTIFNEDSLDKVELNNSILNPQDYTVGSDMILFGKAVFAKLPLGENTIKLTFKSGYTKEVVVDIIDSSIEMLLEMETQNPVFQKGKDAKIAIKAKNITSEQKNATLILALYDQNGKFVSYVAGNYSVNSGETIEMSAMLSIPSNADGYKVKCFVWDTMDSMKPLSEVQVYSVQ